MNGKKAKKLRKRLRKVLEQHPERAGHFKFYFRKAKKLAIGVILIAICSTAYADNIKIPFPCYPKEIQEQFEVYGYKVDLNGNDRTTESWGFIINEGMTYTICTYQPVQKNDFIVINEVVFGGNNGKNVCQ